MSKKKLLFVFLFLSLTAFLYKIPELIQIDTVVCRNQFGKCSEQVENSLNLEGKLGLRSAKKNVSRALNENSSVSEYKMQYKFPKILEVFVLEKRPRFAVRNDEENISALVRADGIVLELAEESNLPTVHSTEKIKGVDEKVDDKTLFALELSNDLHYTQEISRISMVNDHLIVELNSAPKIIFPLEGDKSLLIGKMNLILVELKKESGSDLALSHVREVDLRYQNPVLR